MIHSSSSLATISISPSGLMRTSSNHSVKKRLSLQTAIVGVMTLALFVNCAQQPEPASSTTTPTPTSGSSLTPSPGATAVVRVDALRRFLADSGRAALRVCVFTDASSSANAAQAISLVNQTLQEFARTTLAGIKVDPVTGCSDAPIFIATNSSHPQNSSSTLPAGVPRRVTNYQISPYVLTVAVTTSTRINAIFGSLPTRRGTEQLACDGGNCAEVTTSVYISEGLIGDSNARLAALLEGLGFAGRT